MCQWASRQGRVCATAGAETDLTPPGALGSLLRREPALSPLRYTHASNTNFDEGSGAAARSIVADVWANPMRSFKKILGGANSPECMPCAPRFNRPRQVASSWVCLASSGPRARRGLWERRCRTYELSPPGALPLTISEFMVLMSALLQPLYTPHRPPRQ